MHLTKKSNLCLALTLLLSFTFLLNSCTSEDGDELSEINNVERELLIGTWEASTEAILVTYTFSDNGTGIKFGRDAFTWRLDTNVLTITRNGRQDVSQIIEIDDRNMLLQDANGARAEFIKQ